MMDILKNLKYYEHVLYYDKPLISVLILNDNSLVLQEAIGEFYADDYTYLYLNFNDLLDYFNNIITYPELIKKSNLKISIIFDKITNEYIKTFETDESFIQKYQHLGEYDYCDDNIFKIFLEHYQEKIKQILSS